MLLYFNDVQTTGEAMATYLILNSIFLIGALFVLIIMKGFRWNKAMTGVLVILLITTAIFDSLIVGAGIVAYDESQILGLRIGVAPIEDFFYALLAVILVPSVWRLLGKGKHEHTKDSV